MIEITKNAEGSKVEFAFALVEKANILAEMHSFPHIQKAIDHQVEAISTKQYMQTCW